MTVLAIDAEMCLALVASLTTRGIALTRSRTLRRPSGLAPRNSALDHLRLYLPFLLHPSNIGQPWPPSTLPSSVRLAALIGLELGVQLGHRLTRCLFLAPPLFPTSSCFSYDASPAFARVSRFGRDVSSPALYSWRGELLFSASWHIPPRAYPDTPLSWLSRLPSIRSFTTPSASSERWVTSSSRT